MAVQEVLILNPSTPLNILGGLTPRGEYAGGTDYDVGDSVSYNGSSYVMYVNAGAGTLPTDDTKWQLVAEKGDDGADGSAGADGTDGSNGTDGTDGADGEGVPVGGTTGQVLTKVSDTDFDTDWEDSTGGGSGEELIRGSEFTVENETDVIADPETTNVMYWEDERTAFSWGIEGDVYPRQIFGTDSVDGWILGNGTDNPYGGVGGEIYWGQSDSLEIDTFGETSEINIGAGASGTNLSLVPDGMGGGFLRTQATQGFVINTASAPLTITDESNDPHNLTADSVDGLLYDGSPIGGTLGGDVTGDSTDNTVEKIQSIPINLFPSGPPNLGTPPISIISPLTYDPGNNEFRIFHQEPTYTMQSFWAGEWDSGTEYGGNSIVTQSPNTGQLYLSIQAPNIGIDPSDTDYWLNITQAYSSGTQFLWDPSLTSDGDVWTWDASIAGVGAWTPKPATGSGSGITRTVTTTSGSYTAGTTASTDYVYLIAAAHTTTLPTASGNSNRYTFKNNHSANVTINRAGSDTIDGGTSISLPPQSSVDLISDSTSNWNII